MSIIVNGYLKGEKCERCKEKYPKLFGECNGTDVSCANFDEE